MSATRYTWKGEPDRLDRVLQALGVARSRNAAQQAISQGLVELDDRQALKAGAKVLSGHTVTVKGLDPYVSRGAHKLKAALDRFNLDVRGRVVLDVGASTGGFTQVLLERGAEIVLAIDVGHDQLAPQLAGDGRVRLWEGCNARYLTAQSLHENTGEARLPSLIVGDLSFISLTHVLPALVEVMSTDGDIVLLIKPQFEVGREDIGDGVVSDPALQLSAIERVVQAASYIGLAIHSITESPILGGQGNREFLIHMRQGDMSGDDELREKMTGAVYGEGSEHE